MLVLIGSAVSATLLVCVDIMASLVGYTVDVISR